jgi:hypothetical protein
MPPRNPRPKDEKPQFERFVETVREVEADDTDAALERTIDKIVRPRPIKDRQRRKNGTE